MWSRRDLRAAGEAPDTFRKGRHQIRGKLRRRSRLYLLSHISKLSHVPSFSLLPPELSEIVFFALFFGRKKPMKGLVERGDSSVISTYLLTKATHSSPPTSFILLLYARSICFNALVLSARNGDNSLDQ